MFGINDEKPVFVHRGVWGDVILQHVDNGFSVYPLGIRIITNQFLLTAGYIKTSAHDECGREMWVKAEVKCQV
jgi:hypothetical protein